MKQSFFIVFAFFAMLSTKLAAEDVIELVVIRSEHRLVVKKGDVTLQSFNVALGSAGKKEKLKMGDRATPLGEYRISKIRDSDKFHKFIQINYPNMDDAQRALKSKLITKQQYRKILQAHLLGEMPPQNTALGGALGLHGIGNETKEKLDIHQNFDWTQGCIAMRNEEIDRLSRSIAVGTKIKIIH